VKGRTRHAAENRFDHIEEFAQRLEAKKSRLTDSTSGAVGRNALSMQWRDGGGIQIMSNKPGEWERLIRPVEATSGGSTE
jgi:hypothetical protein